MVWFSMTFEMFEFSFQKKKKVRSSSVTEEATTEVVQWSNTDIEFPSTSTSDEIEIISQEDDEIICKLLSALPVANDAVQNPNDSIDVEESASEINSLTEIKADAETEISGNKNKTLCETVVERFLDSVESRPNYGLL